MKELILPVFLMLLGGCLTFGGVYYLRKEKDDEVSVKIYRTTSIIGIVIAILGILKFIL
ncbi:MULTISPECIES: hypothetical protein [unclassified Clostridium]|uniref:hypothetical protein n=1 Tax=unclassified Clostridium TaxID=2614128 RepID=UPI001EED4B5D|nr:MULTISPECIES: hypothetical protein [unclassified Clostridium]